MNEVKPWAGIKAFRHLGDSNITSAAPKVHHTTKVYQHCRHSSMNVKWAQRYDILKLAPSSNGHTNTEHRAIVFAEFLIALFQPYHCHSNRQQQQPTANTRRWSPCEISASVVKGTTYKYKVSCNCPSRVFTDPIFATSKQKYRK